MVNYSASHGGAELFRLRFTNWYSPNPDFLGDGPTQINAMSQQYLQAHPGANLPFRAFGQWTRVGESRYGDHYLNIGAAPNPDSPNLAGWREELFHELAHHLTNAEDPPSDRMRDRIGPTEILAQRVMHELDFPARLGSSYASAGRNAFQAANSAAGLRDAAQRNAGHEQAFFQRLDTISHGSPASPDFHELQAASANGVEHNQTYVFSAQLPVGDLSQMQFHNGTVSFFPSAYSAPVGVPSGYGSAYAASSASWDTQGRFFQYGTPVNGNPHVREFDFADGSKVIASAHVPQLASSDLTKFQRGATVVGATVAGAMVGLVTGGPAGAVAGGVAGAGAGAGIASTYPYDRIWQGYTLDYYNKGETQPFYTQNMYAWDKNWTRVGELTQQKDAKLWPDYADSNPDSDWEWWKWKSGNAPLRT